MYRHSILPASCFQIAEAARTVAASSIAIEVCPAIQISSRHSIGSAGPMAE